MKPLLRPNTNSSNNAFGGCISDDEHQILPKGLTGQEKEWDLVSILKTADGLSSQYHQSSPDAVSAHHSGAFTPFRTVACCAPANALDRITAKHSPSSSQRLSSVTE